MFNRLADRLFGLPKLPQVGLEAMFAYIVNSCAACGRSVLRHSYTLIARACSAHEAGLVAGTVLRRDWTKLVVGELCRVDGDAWEWYALRCPNSAAIVVIQIFFPIDLNCAAEVMDSETLASDDDRARLQSVLIRDWRLL